MKIINPMILEVIEQIKNNTSRIKNGTTPNEIKANYHVRLTLGHLYEAIAQYSLAVGAMDIADLEIQAVQLEPSPAI